MTRSHKSNFVRSTPCKVLFGLCCVLLPKHVVAKILGALGNAITSGCLIFSMNFGDQVYVFTMPAQCVALSTSTSCKRSQSVQKKSEPFWIHSTCLPGFWLLKRLSSLLQPPHRPSNCRYESWQLRHSWTHGLLNFQLAEQQRGGFHLVKGAAKCCKSVSIYLWLPSSRKICI